MSIQVNDEAALGQERGENTVMQTEKIRNRDRDRSGEAGARRSKRKFLTELKRRGWRKKTSALSIE